MENIETNFQQDTPQIFQKNPQKIDTKVLISIGIILIALLSFDIYTRIKPSQKEITQTVNTVSETASSETVQAEISSNEEIPNEALKPVSDISSPVLPETKKTYTATTIQDTKNSVSKLVIKDQDSNEIVIREDKFWKMGNETVKTNYSDVIFSINNDYVAYMINSYEAGGSFLYDIKSKKEISLDIPAETIGFTSDSKYLYACARGGMMSGGVSVIQLSTLKNIFPVSGDKSFTCNYNQSKKEVSFSELSLASDEEIISKYIFSESTGVVSKK